MMFGFHLFPVGLLALAGLGAVLIAAFVLRKRSDAPRRNWTLWAGVPLGCGCLPLLLMLVPISSGVVWAALRPDSWAFEEVFSVAPPTSLSGLEAKTDPGLDSRVIYLAFDTNPAISAWLARQAASWEPAEPSGWVDSDAARGGPPDWWKGASATVAPHGCARRVHQQFRNVGNWRAISIIDCASDRRIYIVARHIDWRPKRH